MKTSLPSRRTAGFTLIELVISAAVGAMILAGAYLCLSAGLASQKMIDPRVDVLQSARVILAMMSADLRAACPLDKDYAFLGMHRTLGIADADNLDFATHHYTPRREREGDFCEVSYFVQQDPATGRLNLWRRRNPVIAPDPLSGGRREEIARGLEGVRFDYTDGYDWYDTWGQTNSDNKTGLLAQAAANLNGMPEAVRITLSFAANPPAAAPVTEDAVKTPAPPLVFQTVVRLELADSSPAPDSASSNPANAQGDSTPSQPEGASE